MKVGIYYNKNYLSENKSYIDLIKDSFFKNEIECHIVNSYSDLKELDILFVLGGDGTILNIAADCAKFGIKILGINYGHLGFLTEFDPEQVNEAIDLVTNGNFEIQKRTMLQIECGGKTYTALNDVVIQRSTGGSDFSNTIELRAEIDGSTVDNYSSDGIIISTPTGSTAYSLSAGGSILTPDINAFIMTPICAHSLHSRPVVYNDNSVLELFPLNDRAPLILIVDGKVVDIVGSEKVKVIKSANIAQFVTRGNKDFFKKLLIKLNIWSK